MWSEEPPVEAGTIAALAAGCAYTGIDRNEQLRGPYERMLAFFGGGGDARVIFAPCETVALEERKGMETAGAPAA